MKRRPEGRRGNDEPAEKHPSSLTRPRRLAKQNAAQVAAHLRFLRAAASDRQLELDLGSGGRL